MPCGVESIDLRNLAQTNSRRNIGQIGFATGNVHLHGAVRQPDHALQAQLFKEGYLRRVIQHQAATFASGHVFVGVETNGDKIAKGADFFFTPVRPHRLRGILDDT